MYDVYSNEVVTRFVVLVIVVEEVVVVAVSVDILCSLHKICSTTSHYGGALGLGLENFSLLLAACLDGWMVGLLVV